MNASLENKVAVVTGGTSGIGKAAALALAKAGAKVVVAGRRENEGQAVVQAIEKSGGQGIFVKTDVRREADVKATQKLSCLDSTHRKEIWNGEKLSPGDGASTEEEKESHLAS